MSVRLWFRVLLKLIFGLSQMLLAVILAVMVRFVCLVRKLQILLMMFLYFGLFCMVFGLLDICIRMIGILSFVVVFNVFGFCSVCILFQMLVFVLIVICVILGLKVFIEICVVECFCNVLIMGMMWCIFFLSGIGFVFGCVDLLLILMMFVLLCSIFSLCLIVVVWFMKLLLLEKLLGVMLRIFMIKGRLFFWCGWK